MCGLLHEKKSLANMCLNVLNLTLINLTDTFRLQSKWSVGVEKIKSYFLIVSWPSCSKIQKQSSRKVPKVTSAEANTLSAVCGCPVSVCAVQPCHVQTDLQLTKTQRHMRDRGFICSNVIIRRLRLAKAYIFGPTFEFSHLNK